MLKFPSFLLIFLLPQQEGLLVVVVSEVQYLQTSVDQA